MFIVSAILVAAVLFSSTFLLFSTRGFGLRKVHTSLKSLKLSSSNSGLSSCSAILAVLGGNLGTGNISGIAVALTTGGPGAVLWICVAIILASSLKFSGCFIGVFHSTKNKKGLSVGGPMYYFSRAFSGKFVPILLKIFYVVSISLGALTIGNFAQVNSVAISLDSVEFEPLVIGIIMCICTLVVVVGEVKGFSKVVVNIVPLMAFVYVGSCIYILFDYREFILPSFQMIFSSSMGADSIGGAALGFTTWSVVKTGVFRGIFASDSGLGLESILHANVPKHDKEDPLKFAVNQGLLSVLSSIIVSIVCLFTALVLLSTGVWESGLSSTAMCFEAFQRAFPGFSGGYIVTFTLFFFAFTTVIAWNFCAECAIGSVTENKTVLLCWRVFFVAIVPLGAVSSPDFVWYISDMVIPFMLLPNVIALLFLYREPRAALFKLFSK